MVCICEICSCGRHRCPHKPISSQKGPCTLSEYSQVYQPHPLVPTQPFKPNQPPVQGGEFQSQTTQRADYNEKQMDRPYVHKPEQYVRPEGEVAKDTSYQMDYKQKYAAPARPIKHDAARQVGGKFEGEPTYKSDYRRWEPGQRQQPYGSVPAWEPSQLRFEDATTTGTDYKPNAIQPRQSFRPMEAAKTSDQPFADDTNYRNDYKAHRIPDRFVRDREQYKAPSAQMEDMTTNRRDYQPQRGEPTQSFKPEGRAFQSDVPLQDNTTFRDDYKRWPVERPYQHAHEPYKKPVGDMQTETTNQANYKQHPIQLVRAKRPSSVKQVSARFDGTTNYHEDYRKWQAERVTLPQKTEYVPNTNPFEGQSSYKSHYGPQPLQPARSFRPDNTAFQSGQPIDDKTMYRSDYTPKPIQVCDAAFLDQSSSKYKFQDYDQRGHMQYVLQSSVEPLQVRSPMQSQARQRLAMSVA